ncbi:hypothetical protein AAF712_003542 [Marasmius tenuissimus]|uniref:Uncharacterized protein n=1 Tax=Marasmius tenuissimus TaxID=585030 RepID=A0ABR3AAD6_9AGAR
MDRDPAARVSVIQQEDMEEVSISLYGVVPVGDAIRGTERNDERLRICYIATFGATNSNTNSEEKKPVDGLGNVPLRMWVGERSLDIHRRMGNTRAARKQETANAALREAVAAHVAAGST